MFHWSNNPSCLGSLANNGTYQGTNFKDLLAWTKRLQGRFEQDQMSCKGDII